MNFGKIARRFLTPPIVVTLIGLIRFGCRISPRAEVELSPNLKIGKGTDIGSFTKIKSADGPLEIGAHVAIGNSSFISASEGGVQIGDYSMISPNVTIVGNSYRYDRLDVPVCNQEKTSKGIRIGRDVWIGAGSVILDGAHIGEGSIVSANSSISGRIPNYSVVQGNPGKVIFTRR